MDPYATLGVTREAETAVIASAYRALAKLYHPDRYSGDREFATRRLKEINAAYEILSNEEKRKAYDAENTKQYSKGAGYQSSSEGEDEKVLNAIEAEWDYATNFHPVLVQLRAELRQIDQSLANAFVAYLVLSKSYSDAPSAFGMFKDEYLFKKFGDQENVRELAYAAIKSGNRSFALDLNEALMRLGQSSTEEVLKHLATQHPEFAETAYPKFGFRHLLKTLIQRRELNRRKVIDHSDAAASAWEDIKSLPEEYQQRFLASLDQEPTLDVGPLAAQLIADRAKELRPYDDEDANDSLEQARTISVEAEQEFREVYNMLGSSLTPSEILKKIESKFGPSAKTISERERQRREAQKEQRRREVELRKEERQQLERMKMVLVFCGAALLFLMVIFSAFQ